LKWIPRKQLKKPSIHSTVKITKAEKWSFLKPDPQDHAVNLAAAAEEVVDMVEEEVDTVEEEIKVKICKSAKLTYNRAQLDYLGN
jgi:hypothetical protein